MKIELVLDYNCYLSSTYFNLFYLEISMKLGTLIYFLSVPKVTFSNKSHIKMACLSSSALLFQAPCYLNFLQPLVVFRNTLLRYIPLTDKWMIEHQQLPERGVIVPVCTKK